jgi:uncharacterized protein
MENIESFTPNLRDKQFNEQVMPNNPHWNWWTAFFVWVMSIVFIVVLQSVAVGGYLFANKLQYLEKEELQQHVTTNPTAVLFAIGSVIFAHICTLLLAWFVVTKNRKYSFTKMLGWKWNGFYWWHCLVVVGLFYILAAGLIAIFGEQDNDFKRMLATSRTVVYVIAFMATFTAPIVEEVVYRGIMYSAALKEFGKTQAIIATTAYFALVHVPQYFPDFSAIIALCILSLVLTYVRSKTNNLLPCIALHTIFNGSQSILLLLQPYLESLVPATTEEKPAIILLTIYRIIHGSI